MRYVRTNERGGKREAAQERRLGATPIRLVGQGSPRQRSRSDFRRRRLIRRYLLARSAEQFSRVKIGALHSGKGYRGIKEEQEEEEEEEEKKRTKRKRYNM